MIARRRRTFRSAGFTLVELSTATFVLVVCVGVVFGLMARTQDFQGRAITVADLGARATMALERIVRELRDSGLSTLSPEPLPPLGTSALAFRRATGLAGSSVTYGPYERIEWQLAPGELADKADNNGNGLVDEGRIVWILEPGTGNERVVVLCDAVARYAEGEIANGFDDNGNGLADELGLSFEISQKVLTIRLTLERRTPAGEIVRLSRSTSTLLQNP